MPNLDIHSFVWTGFKGSPGVSTFVAFSGPPFTAEEIKTSIMAFFQNINGVFPNGLGIKHAASYKTVDMATGVLQSETIYSVSSPIVVGTGGGSYAGPAGAVVNWRTSQIGTRRNIRGRTYLVPLSTGSYDGIGTLLDSSLGLLRTEAERLRTATAPSLAVWRRPRPAQVAPKVPRPAVVGLAGVIATTSVPDMVAMLRSRR